MRAQDVNTAWNDWSLLVTKAVEHHIPKRTITIRPQNKPWMNSSLHKLSREKNRLFRAAKNPQSPVTWEQYKSARNRFNSHKTNTSLGLTTISVIYDRRQRRGGPKRSALQRFPARLNLSHPYSHLQVRLLTPMAKRPTFSRNSLRSNVHPWTKQKSSPRVHRNLSPRTTRPSPSRRFRSQPCSAIYVNYQRTKLQLCRMDSQTGFSKQLPQQLPNLLRTFSISR